MAAVAVHRCEDLSALLRRLLVTVVGVPARDRGQGGRGGAAREDVLVLAHGGWRAGRIRSSACAECRHDGGHETTGETVSPVHAMLPLQRVRPRLSRATPPPSRSPRSPARSQLSRRRRRHAPPGHPTPLAPPWRRYPRASTRTRPRRPTIPQTRPPRRLPTAPPRPPPPPPTRH